MTRRVPPRCPPAERIWCDHRFTLAAHIQPDRDAEGEPKQIQHFPPGAPNLNPYGHLAFCSFPTPDLPRTSGVYGLTVDDELVYVGKARDLREVWGSSGYAQIFPSNCRRKTKDTGKGQYTSCRINHRILCVASDGLTIDLWIHETAAPKSLRDSLIEQLDPPWNRRP